MPFIRILAIAYGLVCFFYLAYASIVAVKKENMKGQLKVLFPVIHDYVPEIKRIVLSLLAVATMTLIIAAGLVQEQPWAMVAATLLSIWEVILSYGFYYLRRKEIINAAGHFIIHIIIAYYLIITIIFS